jgi:hypothetical protein
MHSFFGIFETFFGGLMVHELECFLDFSQTSGMLSATAYVVEFAQVAHFKGGQGGAGCF